MTTNRVRLAVAAAIVILLTNAARADILVSNIGEPVRDTTVIENALWAAQSFVNDGSVRRLSSIRAVIGGESGSAGAFAELRRGTTSGTIVTSFVLPGLAGPPGARTLTPLGLTVLDPGETYWLVFGAAGPGGFGWSYAEGNSQTGPGALGPYEYSTDQGASWTNFGSDNPYLVEVNTVPGAVPEPASWALMIAGFGLAGGQLRWRRLPAARRILA